MGKQLSLFQKKEEPATRNLRVVGIEDCGRTVKLHWIAEDDGERGYTEIRRETYDLHANSLPPLHPTRSFFDTLTSLQNGEL
jgi:hypothetical protein